MIESTPFHWQENKAISFGNQSMSGAALMTNKRRTTGKMTCWKLIFWEACCSCLSLISLPTTGVIFVWFQRLLNAGTLKSGRKTCLEVMACHKATRDVCFTSLELYLGAKKSTARQKKIALILKWLCDKKKSYRKKSNGKKQRK